MRLFLPIRALGMPFGLLLLAACGGQASLMQPLPPSSMQQTGSNVVLPGNPSSSEFLGINDLGDIAVAAGEGQLTTAYVAHSPYGQSDVKGRKFPGSVSTMVTALNDAGLVAGFYTDARGHTAAFAERGGVWTPYRGPSRATEYLGVNDAGVAVGFYTDRRGDRHAFEHAINGESLIEIRPAGSSSTTAAAINAAGTVVGYTATSHGRVVAFLWKSGRVTKFSYPGAAATRALGISKVGRIVGSYDDAWGNTHGFVVSDLATHPQWKAFDEPQARGLTVLTGINTRGDLVGYYQDGNSRKRSLFKPEIKQLTNVPLVIPVWGVGAGDPGSTDPGATPDQHLFAVIFDDSEVTSASVAKNCPGVSSSSTCQAYKYANFFVLHCNTVNSLAAYRWANTNEETAFLHNYPNGKWTASNRMTYQETPNSHCVPNSHNASMRMNPGDSEYNTYIYNNYWNGSSYTNDVPSPYGVMEDEASIPAGIDVGGSSAVSTEYGSGTNPSGFADQVGKSQYHAATDFETAIGIFINGACGSKCVDVAFNGPVLGSGNFDACSVISNGHCHAQYSAGVIDDQSALDNVCNKATHGNLTYFVMERPIWMGRLGKGFLNSQTMTIDINTSANLYSHTSDGCATAKLVDLETSYGAGGLGDVTGGHRVRLAALAYRWLVANPSNGIPDRVISYQTTEGGTKSEAPYFFEDTLVPYGAEINVPKFVWNGKTETVGGGCPSADGDTGGAVALKVQCVGPDGIFCQQYQHLYINGTDHGKVAACLNTSTTTENIVSSWFKHDPMSSYKHELALYGGEMTSVPYQGVSGGSITMTTCTNQNYCTGKNTLWSQVTTFKGDGTDQLCGPCGVILMQND